MDQTPEHKFEVTGPPVSPDIQKVFGRFGTVKGVWVRSDGVICVSYGIGMILEYRPTTPVPESDI